MVGLYKDPKGKNLSTVLQTSGLNLQSKTNNVAQSMTTELPNTLNKNVSFQLYLIIPQFLMYHFGGVSISQQAIQKGVQEKSCMIKIFECYC